MSMSMDILDGEEDMDSFFDGLMRTKVSCGGRSRSGPVNQVPDIWRITKWTWVGMLV